MQLLNSMFGSCLIAIFRLTMDGQRGVVTCSRGSPGESTGSYPFKIGREQRVPESSNHSLFSLKTRETSEGTSYQMVRLVFRHLAADERFARQYRHEPLPEFPLTLPF